MSLIVIMNIFNSIQIIKLIPEKLGSFFFSLLFLDFSVPYISNGSVFIYNSLFDVG